MSTPDPDPWAEGNYGPSADPLPPDLADSMASWASAQAAAADAPVPYALTGRAEAALDAGPEAEAEVSWRESMAAAYLYGTFEPSPSTAEAKAFAEMGAYARAEAERVAALDEADAAYAAARANEPVPEPDLEAEPW
jgi:hypothetical protein